MGISRKIAKRKAPRSHGIDIEFCESCFEKQRRIDILEEENKLLKQKLRYREKQNKEGFFGLSTSSAKKPVKENTLAENIDKKGGAQTGHKGNGRKKITTEKADEIISLKVEKSCCPYCGSKLKHKDTILKSVVDTVLMKAKNILYSCEKLICTECKRTIEAKPPVLPKNKYGNNLVGNSVVMHYFHGFPLKRIENMWGEKVVAGILIKIFHRLAKFWEPAIDEIKKEYRKHPVKHADETGWRTDGKSGYAWLFCTKNISLFTFRDNRSSRVPREIFGTKKLPGVLVVDRYASYNKTPVKIQYCFAHLLRDLEKLGNEFPDNNEIQAFVSNLAPLISEAMHLQTKNISDTKYYHKTKLLKAEIMKLIRAPAKHPGIKSYQDIFCDKEHRMFHWVKDRSIPSHNNRAERELRPTVIARKVSFGSQSVEGAKTRSILMTILHSAAKRLRLKNQSLEEWFVWSLHQFSMNPNINPYSLLPK